MIRSRTRSIGREVHRIPGRFKFTPKWMQAQKDMEKSSWGSTVPEEEYQATKDALRIAEEKRGVLEEEHIRLQEKNSVLQEEVVKRASELEALKKLLTDTKCQKWLEDASGRSTIIAVREETSKKILDTETDTTKHENRIFHICEKVHQCNIGDGDDDANPSFSSWGSYTANEHRMASSCPKTENTTNKEQHGRGMGKNPRPSPLGGDRSHIFIPNSIMPREDQTTQITEPCEMKAVESLGNHIMSPSEKRKSKQTCVATDTNDLELHQASSELSDLNTQLESVQNALRDQQNVNSSQRFEQHQIICEWKAKCDEAQAQKVEITKQVNQFQKCIEALEKNRKDLEEQVSSDQKNIENLTSALKSAQKKQSEMEKLLEEETKAKLNQTLKDSKRFDKSEREISRLQESIKEIADEKNLAREEVSRLKSLLEQRDKSLKSGKLTLQQTMQSARDENMDSIKRLTELSERVRTLEAENSILACQKDDLSGTIVELQNDLSTCAQEHQHMKSCIKDKDSCISSVQNQVKNLEQEKSSLNERVKRMERISLEANRARELCKSKIMELENKLAEMKIEKDKCEGKIKKLKEKQTSSLSQIESLKAQHASDTANMENSNLKVTESEIQIADLMEKIKQKDNEILDIKQRCVARSNANSVLQGKLDEEHAEVLCLKSELDTKSAQLEEQRQEIGRLKTVHQDVENKLQIAEKCKQEYMKERDNASQRESLTAMELLEKEKELQDCRKDFDVEKKALKFLEQQAKEAILKVAHLEEEQKDHVDYKQRMHIQIEALDDQLRCQSEVSKRLEESRMFQENQHKTYQNKISDLQKLVKLQETELHNIQTRRSGGPGFVQELLADKNERLVTCTKLQNIARKLEMKTGLGSDPSPLQVIHCIHRILAQLEEQCEQHKIRRPKDSARLSLDERQAQNCSAKVGENAVSIPLQGKSVIESQHRDQCAVAAQNVGSGSSKAITAWRGAGRRGTGTARLQSKGIAPLRHPQKLIILN